MKFKKEFLIDIIDTCDVVLNEVIDHSRWSMHYRMIFRHNNKYYESYYSVGATEQQDESPYEYDPDEIECDEVKQVEKVVIVWEKVNETTT
ncbi:MAG TPA: hypothetical protein VMW10_03690 [Alphaproteobacteria bacterium]|nr:hypothetical protein [Alphaproteobacteria bacterium]